MPDLDASRWAGPATEVPVTLSPLDIQCLIRLLQQLTSQEVHPRAAISLRADLPTVARLLLAQRRDRDLAFGDCDLAGPAWDIMLALFVAQAEGRDSGALALARSMSAPNSTILRWIAIMRRRGQLLQEADLTDRRRSVIRLAPAFRERIARHLEQTAGLLGARIGSKTD